MTPAAREALEAAEVVLGPPRHLALLPELAAERIEWPVPFVDGLPLLVEQRGRRAVMLVSGDPFWFGAGRAVARTLERSEWRALPGPSTFSHAAARLGWPLEDTTCLGLHAAPLMRLRPHLAPGQRALVLLRDGAAVAELAAWLTDLGFGESTLHILEALGGPWERVRSTTADDFTLTDVAHPVAVGLEVAGDGAVIPAASGRPDALFESDGQLTRRPVRALTLSALAPCPGEHLWDIGLGAGSIAIEWLMSHPACIATGIEADPERAARARRNADALGVDRLRVVQGRAPDALEKLPKPDAVFIGGGLSEEMLHHLWTTLPTSTRLVANAVTLESEALLTRWQSKVGGELMRIALSNVTPVGGKRAWKAAYPIVQWSATR